MARYRVLTPLMHDSKSYNIGSFVSLTDKQACSMPWAVKCVDDIKRDAEAVVKESALMDAELDAELESVEDVEEDVEEDIDTPAKKKYQRKKT